MKEKYNKGFRAGIGVVLLFVVTPLILILGSPPKWLGALIILIIWIPTIFWLSSKNNP